MKINTSSEIKIDWKKRTDGKHGLSCTFELKLINWYHLIRLVLTAFSKRAAKKEDINSNKNNIKCISLHSLFIWQTNVAQWSEQRCFDTRVEWHAVDAKNRYLLHIIHAFETHWNWIFRLVNTVNRVSQMNVLEKRSVFGNNPFVCANLHISSTTLACQAVCLCSFALACSIAPNKWCCERNPDSNQTQSQIIHLTLHAHVFCTLCRLTRLIWMNLRYLTTREFIQF